MFIILTPYNSNSQKRERIGRVLQMHANDREDLDEIRAGDIGAIVGLKNTKTGDTLCVENNQIVLESMTFPEPVISLAIEPKTKADRDKLNDSLRRLADDLLLKLLETRTLDKLLFPVWGNYISKLLKIAL